MAGCCPGSGGSAIIQAKRELDGVGGNGNMNTQIDPNTDLVRMEYFGERIGAVSFHGKRRIYRFGNNTIDRYNDVNPEDVETLLRQPGFRTIGRYVHNYMPPDAIFVPEPSGAVVAEVAPPVEEVAWVHEEIPTPSGEVYGGQVEEGKPPLLEIAPLPNTVKEIKSAVLGADLDTLLAWLREEQSDKNRKTALDAIEYALEDK